jgi:membrane protein DedA with SNARE-associated domain
MHELVALLLGHGALIIFAVTLAARIGAPVPASPLLVVAGSLAMAGQISMVTALGTSIAANILGDGAWFLAGRRHGYRVMKQLCRISLSPDSCVRQSESLITRWGGRSLIAAKFVPGVSVIAAPMAGALGMSSARFLALEVVAAVAWTLAFMALGMVFSDQIQQIFDIMASTGGMATARSPSRPASTSTSCSTTDSAAPFPSRMRRMRTGRSICTCGASRAAVSPATCSTQ